MIKRINFNIIQICFSVVFIIAILCVALSHRGYEASFDFDDGSIAEWSESWEVNVDGNITQNISLPYEIPEHENDSIILRKTLPEKIKTYNCIMLEGRRQDISVSIGGIQRISFSDKNYRIWGKTSPSGIVLVPLYNTDSLEDVAIHVSSDSLFSGKVGKIYLGNEKSLVVMIIKSNIIWFFLTIIVLIIGITSLVTYFIYGSEFCIGKAILNLAFFSILSAVWAFTQSGLRQLFFDDLTVLESIGYCCYMVIPFTVVMYVNRILDEKYIVLRNVFGIILLANFVLQNIIAWTLKIGFYEMRYVTGGLYVVLLFILLVICMHEGNGGFGVNTICLLIGIVSLVIGIIAGVSFVDIHFLGEANNRYIGGAFIFDCAGFVYSQICVSKEQKQNKNSENANIAKTRFLADSAQDIKRSLNAMLDMNEMILLDSNEDAINEYATNINNAGQSLAALVNNILDYSMIEAGRVEIKNDSYKMKALLNDLIIMTQSQLSGKKVKFVDNIDETIPTECIGDVVRIKQALSNILSNGINNISEGTITFSVKNYGVYGDFIKLYFSVSDTGIDINKENLEGSELGLTITSQLLKLMNSRLEVDNENGNGNHFHFQIIQKIVDNTPIGFI